MTRSMPRQKSQSGAPQFPNGHGTGWIPEGGVDVQAPVITEPFDLVQPRTAENSQPGRRERRGHHRPGIFLFGGGEAGFPCLASAFFFSILKTKSANPAHCGRIINRKADLVFEISRERGTGSDGEARLGDAFPIPFRFQQGRQNEGIRGTLSRAQKILGFWIGGGADDRNSQSRKVVLVGSQGVGGNGQR